MKRKHSQSSPQTRCQLISKFFKTSEKQDVSNAPTVMQNTDPPENSQSREKKSNVEPVLQRLTNLREALLKRGGLFKNLFTEDENKKEDIDNTNPSKVNNDCGEYENSSKNPSVDCPDTPEKSSMSSKDNTDSQDISKKVEISSNLQLDNVDSRNVSNIETDIKEHKHNCDTTYLETKSLDIDSNSKDKPMEYSLQQTEDHLINDSELMDDSEESQMDRNTEGNLGDDEDEPETAHDNQTTNVIERETRENLDCVFKKLSRTHETQDYSLNSQNSLKSDSEDDLNGNTSDSDDDLLTPPSFLYENKTKIENVLRTPDRLITPVGSSPLSSPVKPARDMKTLIEDKSYKFSLQQMLKDRNKKEEKNVELSKMQADLDAGLKKGGITTMIRMGSGDDTDTDVDDGKDLRDLKLPEEVSKYLVTVSDFLEELSGEDIFPGFHMCTVDNDLPKLHLPSPLREEEFVANLMSCEPCVVREMICGGWFMQYYLKRPCPAPLAQWLFHIMTHSPDIYLSGHCFKTLWALLQAGYQDTNGIPKGIRGMDWVPSIKDIVSVLQYCGATMETLTPKQLTSSGLIIPINISSKEDEKPDISPQSKFKPQLVFIIKQLVQLLTHALHYAGCKYMEDELPLLLVIVCRLSLDIKLQELLFELEICVYEILNCFGGAQWEEQIKTLPLVLVNTSTNHRNLLQIMQVLPPSPRGSKLRQLSCLTLIRQFVKEFGDSKLKTEEFQGFSKSESFEISELSVLIEEIKPKQRSTCDYHLLHSVVSLIDLAIGNEDYPSSKRKDLNTLSEKLKSLNGEIKDPKARFLDRTKVKDLIVRTAHKIKCLVDSIQPAKEKDLTEYFQVNSSDYVVQQLAESTVAPSYEEASSPENDNTTSPGSPNPQSDGEDPLMMP